MSGKGKPLDYRPHYSLSESPHGTTGTSRLRNSIQEHLQILNLQDYLPLLASGNPTYMSMDTTDIEKPRAKKAPYVGYIKGEGVKELEEQSTGIGQYPFLKPFTKKR